ncbi:hypothetical protein T11_15412 [Trichinella zimbabwensis]|uniref:Uncharacterized protein n=1 Tax=Trichinella zimbabwensis TaxID=268475 RepID=A0A0V1H9U2_9BILA|nr:hypothetical protein T11_15412 [Trichinella zimbabwensis]
MDGKKLLIPFKYNLECTIHASGSPGCQQSNVGTRRKYQDLLQIQAVQAVWVSLCPVIVHRGTERKIIQRTQERKAQKPNARPKENEFDAVWETRISSLEFPSFSNIPVYLSSSVSYV